MGGSGSLKGMWPGQWLPFSLQEKLERVILGSKAAQEQPEEVRDLWQTCGELMFSLEPGLRHLGLGKEVSPTLQELGKWEGVLEAAWYAWEGS